jgi:hypothetical protein
MSFVKSILILLGLSLSACAHVEIKDQPWWADIGELGALEFHTLTPEEKEIPKSEWDKKRVGMVCTTTDIFSENKKNILKLCTDNPRCTFEQKKALQKFIKDMEHLDAMLAELRLEQ